MSFLLLISLIPSSRRDDVRERREGGEGKGTRGEREGQREKEGKEREGEGRRKGRGEGREGEWEGERRRKREGEGEGVGNREGILVKERVIRTSLLSSLPDTDVKCRDLAAAEVDLLECDEVDFNGWGILSGLFPLLYCNLFPISLLSSDS